MKTSKEYMIILEEPSKRTTKEAMNALLLKKNTTIIEAEEFQVEGCIRINEFTWNNQEKACNFINNSFPKIETLQLLT